MNNKWKIPCPFHKAVIEKKEEITDGHTHRCTNTACDTQAHTFKNTSHRCLNCTDWYTGNDVLYNRVTSLAIETGAVGVMFSLKTKSCLLFDTEDRLRFMLYHSLHPGLKAVFAI